MSEIKFCPFCGKGLISGAKFCPYCGNQITWLTEQKAPQAGERKTTLPPHPPRPPPLRPRVAAWPAPKTAEEVTEVKVIYEKLLYVYTSFYGDGRQFLEKKIDKYMKLGLSREEAIKKVAIDEGYNLANFK